MATRFYFTAASAPAITPAYDAEWEKTGNAVRRLLSRTKLNTIANTSSDQESFATSPYDILNRQLISKPLQAQTITGTVKGQMRCQQDADGDYCRAIVIKVVSSDGSTVRGTLLSHFPGSLTSEFDESDLVNRYFPPSTAVTQVVAQDGDYLVVELGARAFNTTADTKYFYLRFRDSAGLSDLPENETGTDDYAPWIEFSHDFLIQGEYDGTAQVSFAVESDSYKLAELDGQAAFALGVISTVEVNAVLDGQASFTFVVASVVEAPLAFDGQAAFAFGVASDVSVIDTVHILDGTVSLALAPSSDIGVYNLPLELSGGVAAGGELDFEVLDPVIHRVELSGGVVAGGILEFEIPEAITYEHELEGGVAVGGEPGYAFFDPSTLTPVELTLSGRVAVGGALTVQHIGTEDLINALTLTGGVVVGEIRLPPIATTAPVDSEAEILTLTLKGGVAVGGTLAFVEDEPETYEHIPRFGGLRVGGALIFSTLAPPSFALELAGGVSIGGTVFEEEELVETWALSGFSFSASMYSGFPFNSYAQHRNQAFAAGEDGVYLLEGADDNGEEFFTGLRIGPTNFGSDNLKRLRGVYPGVAGNPELRVKGEQNQQEGFYQLGRRERFNCGREVQDRVMILDLHNFDELSHLEIIPLVLMRR